MTNQFRSSARSFERTPPTARNQWDEHRPVRCRQAARTLEELRLSRQLPSRLLVDATYTLGSSRRSGIERVVRNLLAHCPALTTHTTSTPPSVSLNPTELNPTELDSSELDSAEPSGGPCVTLMSMHGQFFNIGRQQQQRLDRVLRTQSDIVSSLPKLYRRLIAPMVKRLGSEKLQTWLLPQPGHMGLFKLPYRYWYKQQMARVCAQAEPLQPGAGDLLVLPDAYWARKEIWPAVAQARQRGAYTAVVVYDLIPLTHPQFVGSRRSRRFEEYLKQVATHADMILAISHTVRRQLEETLPQLMNGTPYCQTIVDFPLGAEFPQRAADTPVRASVEQLFSGPVEERPYLTVAAFDPRKNHRYLLDAFDLWWTRSLPAARDGRPLPKLCLVGRVGGRCDDIMQRIAHHPLLGRQLFTFHDLNDAELEKCYQQCRGVIFPSITEGFGLPIVEALWHGARTLASDTAIHREVGGDNCEYFDLQRPAALVELLSRPSVEQPVGAMRPYTWCESAEIFFSQCLLGYRHYQVGQSAIGLARSA